MNPLFQQDLLGGFFRNISGTTTGMGRTDSEAAFQEFLKRIPSTTNLAAAASQLEGQAQAAQVLLQSSGNSGGATGGAAPNPASSSAPAVATSAAALAPSLPTVPLSTTPPDVPSSAIPRVPSLDFLRQLMANNATTQSLVANAGPPPVKLEAPVATSAPALPAVDPVMPKPLALPPGSVPPPYVGMLPGLSPSDLASLSAVGTNLSAALQAVPGFSSAAAVAAAGNPLAAAALNPAAAAAAALQLGQLGQLSRLTAQPGTMGDKETVEKAEVRRARRMLSNRESARRSRRRKQEHLSKLECEVQVVVEEKKSIQDQLAYAERMAKTYEEENKRLREENERLRDELKFLRTEITERKERNGYYRREQESDEEQQPVKRHRGAAAKEAADAKKDDS